MIFLWKPHCRAINGTRRQLLPCLLRRRAPIGRRRSGRSASLTGARRAASHSLGDRVQDSRQPLLELIEMRRQRVLIPRLLVAVVVVPERRAVREHGADGPPQRLHLRQSVLAHSVEHRLALRGFAVGVWVGVDRQIVMVDEKFDGLVGVLVRQRECFGARIEVLRGLGGVSVLFPLHRATDDG